MTTGSGNLAENDNRPDDEIEYGVFCNLLENQYKQGKEEGVFEILKVLDLDKEHSDSNLVKAIDYFNKKNGVVEADAPMDCMDEREKRMIHKDGKFRPALYCMLLSKKFSEGIKNKTVFLQHSFKYSFT